MIRRQPPGHRPPEGPGPSTDAVEAGVPLPAGPAHPSGPRALSGPSRAWRVAVVLVLTAGYLGGSLVGDDHWWPFAPWRMFSTSTKPTGTVTVSALEIRTASDPQWRGTGLNPANVGLNRAEVEGQQPEIRADPARLGTLAESHARLRPGSEPWTGVRLVRRSTVIEDRRPTGETVTRVIAEWTEEDGGRVVDEVVTP